MNRDCRPRAGYAAWRPRSRPFGSRAGRAHIIVVVGLLLVSALAFLYAMRLRRSKTESAITLAIKCQPSPAEVRLDGRFIGLTPMVIHDVAEGEHLVSLSLEGYENHAETTRLGGGRHEVNVRLERESAGSLSVHTRPEGAEVILDGQSRGNTPLEIGALRAGSYRIVLRKAGHEIFNRQLLIKSGEKTSIDAKLDNSVLKFLRGAVANNPKSLHYWTELGHYLGCHNMDKESAQAFKQGMILCMAAEAKSDEVRRHFQMLGRQMNWPGKDLSVFRKEIGDAFSELVKKHSGDPKGMVRLAGVLEGARRSKEALELYLRACRLNKGAEPNLLIKGFSLAARLKRMADAREFLKLLRTGRPKDHSTRTRIADLCMQSYSRYQGSTRKELLGIAESLYGEAGGMTSVASYKSRAYYGAARAQGFAGKTKEAADSYGKAAAAILAGGKSGRSKWADYEFERANLLVKLSRVTDARGVLTRIVNEGGKAPAVARARKELERLKPAAGNQ